MNRGLTILTLMMVISVFPAASIYAWQMTQVKPESNLLEFKILVNERQEVIIYVPVNLDDGYTIEECKLIAEKAFISIMGDVIHRLDKLSLEGSKMNASYIWGLNENDLGHSFYLFGDLLSHMFTVTHCR